MTQKDTKGHKRIQTNIKWKMSKDIKIKIGNEKEFEAMFRSKIVSSGNGGVAKALKKYIGKDVIILVEKDDYLVGSAKEYDIMMED